MDAHTMELAMLVSQATFTLTLSLLACSERQMRGLVWLAGACGLEFLATALRPAADRSRHGAGGAILACLLLLTLFSVHVGLRSFLTRRRLRPSGIPLALCVWMLCVLAVAPFSAQWSVELARLGALLLMGTTVAMLWHARVLALRFHARATALLLGSLMAVFLVNLVVGAEPQASPLGEACLRLSTLLLTLLPLTFLPLFTEENKRRLHEETRVDALTGLRNRRAMEETAAREMRTAADSGRPLALLMMDLDAFKSLNDTWGHAVGDRALRTVGGVLLTATGGGAMVARMGGEEFAVLLPGRDLRAAQALAERVRGSVAGLRLDEGQRMVSFTISIGIGVRHAGDRDWTEMLRRADMALYRAKREGRNRVAACADAPDNAAERVAAVAVRRFRGRPAAGPLSAAVPTEAPETSPALH